jgi:hypothetical protein
MGQAGNPAVKRCIRDGMVTVDGKPIDRFRID